jgi:hypothetical protein
VLDLTGEDADGLKAQQRQYQWDKRKKRYVQRTGASAGAGERAGSRAGGRNEAGKAIAGGKRGEEQKGQLYKKWARQNKSRVAAAGAIEDDGRVAAELAKRFSPSHRHKSWKSALGGGGGGGGPAQGAAKRGGELRPKAQIAKERRKKEELQQRMKERQKANAARAKRSEKKGRKAGSGGSGGGGKRR